MFAAILWLSVAAFTVLWAVIGGEWWGVGACALLGVRNMLLVYTLVLLTDPRERAAARSTYKRPPAAVRIGDFLFDFGFLAVFGVLAQHGARYGMPAVLLFLGGVLLHALIVATMEPKR
jgi:hypothetical protein